MEKADRSLWEQDRKKDGAKRKGEAERQGEIEIRQMYSRMDKQNLIKEKQ